MVDVGDDLALLFGQGRTDDHEDHRAGPPGLFVNFLDMRVERNRVSGPDWRDEFDVLAGVEALLAVARNVLKEMTAVAESNGERGRRDDPAERTGFRRRLVGKNRIGLVNRGAKRRDLLGRDRHRLRGFEDAADQSRIVIDCHACFTSTGVACGTGLRRGRKSTGAYSPDFNSRTRSSIVRISASKRVAQRPIRLTRWLSEPPIER